MIKVIKLKKIVFFVILFFSILGILYYKNFLFGNNISKNRNSKQLEEMLSSMENYSAEIKVIVSSNKTQNEYVIKQEVCGEDSMQEILQGEGIEGVKIERKQKQLRVSNAKLELEKVYENYPDLLNNSLFLNSFVADYRDETNEIKCQEKNGEMLLEVKLNHAQNTYTQYKTLYVNVQTGKPTKLTIKSHLKNETICIL